MAGRVFLHVGLPKTGTTYLQSILWANRDELRDQGVLLPGFGPRQHLWASGAVREDPRLERRHADAPRAWDVLSAEAREWSGTTVISHEFFAGASAEQAGRAVADLGDAEVHVVVTARDLPGLVTARWQEIVKNGSTRAIDDYPPEEDRGPADEWGWRTMDLADVAARWASAVGPARVHVLTMPGPEEPRDALWVRFAGLVGIDAASCDAGSPEQNQSLGVVEVELLRRINADVHGFERAVDRGVWIRGYLAQDRLVPRGGERFWPAPDRLAELRARGEAIADAVAAAGYDVIGDPDRLRSPADLPERRHPASVTDAEMLAAATSLTAAMLTDVRRLTQEAKDAGRRRAGGAEGEGAASGRGLRSRWRSLWSRS